MEDTEELVFVVKYQPLNAGGDDLYVNRYIGPFTFRALAEECLCMLAKRKNVGMARLLEVSAQEANGLLSW